MRYFLTVILLLISVVGSAAIYMQVDKNGNTTYSDTPGPGSQPVDVTQQSGVNQLSTPITSDANSTPPPKKTADKAGTPTPTATTPAKPAADEHVPYTTFSIGSPTDQYTFQNQREIPVQIDIMPDLQKGDKVIVFLDGQQVGDAVASVNFTLHQVNRGTHVVSAELIDANQLVLKQTTAITFYVHYAALGGAGGGAGG